MSTHVSGQRVDYLKRPKDSILTEIRMLETRRKIYQANIKQVQKILTKNRLPHLDEIETPQDAIEYDAIFEKNCGLVRTLHHCEERINYIDSRIKVLLERLALKEVPSESQDA